MWRNLLLLVLSVAGLTLAVAGQSFGAAGQAVGVDPQADLITATGSMTLAIGTDVDVGQTINTGDAGQVELLFGEGTKLVIGPDSSLVIEDYLLRDEGGAGSFAVNALAGTFRFFTGSMAKSSYRIDTPTGTLGVRGTIFDLYVVRHLNAVVTLLEGGINVCRGNPQVCEQVDVEKGTPCSVSFMSVDLNGIEDFDSDTFSGYFPYLKSDERLSRPFRVGNGRACFRSVTQTTTSAIVTQQASPS